MSNHLAAHPALLERANNGTPILSVAVSDIQDVPSLILCELDFEHARVEHSLPALNKGIPSNPVLEFLNSALPEDAQGTNCDISSEATFFIGIRREPVAELRCQHPDHGRERGGDENHQ